MAALAVPLVEAAAATLARALGVAAVAGAGAVAIEKAKKKAESADKAKSAPIAQAGSQEKKKDSCSKCPPDCGTLVERTWNMSEVSRAYQARITGFAPYTEWNFEVTDFDGFKSQGCLLLEAKAMYDQFFNSAVEPKFFFQIVGIRKVINQAQRQGGIVAASPPSQMHWHFMQPWSHAYFSAEFESLFLPITTFLTP